jgi:guanylate kinase
MNKRKGILFVVSGPSGVGKTTLCNKLLKQDKNIVFSISCTTRPKRKTEKNGREYYFLTKEKFLKAIKNNEFIEWAKVYDNYYGTPKKFLDKNLKLGKDVLLDIDVQGVKKIKKLYKDAVYIFIAPPSTEELKKRILGRNTETKKSLQKRLSVALKELKLIYLYDYVIKNVKLDKAIKDLKSIVKEERCRNANTKL